MPQFPSIPKIPQTQRYGIYSRKTSRSRGELMTIMFDARAAEIHADEMCAAKGFASCEVVPERSDRELPQFID